MRGLSRSTQKKRHKCRITCIQNAKKIAQMLTILTKVIAFQGIIFYRKELK